MDIEDLHTLGMQRNFCPYYLNRMRAEKADIVLMPYNYVTHARLRKLLKIDLKNDVLIIDEAHNIPEVIEDSCSFKLTTETMRRVLGEYGQIYR